MSHMLDSRPASFMDPTKERNKLPIHLYDPLRASVHAVQSSLGGSRVDAWARFVFSYVVLRSFAHFHLSITNNVLGSPKKTC